MCPRNPYAFIETNWFRKSNRNIPLNDETVPITFVYVSSRFLITLLGWYAKLGKGGEDEQSTDFGGHQEGRIHFDSGW